ncbi:hypothetical protein [Lewinella sp. 4G2]|uniref:hypothetical protein n=1 Tax=Lewinella sp. 4G2 TaxID=1803372 RepID=UPI0007B49CF9|nr:hypothetical protein [Lewinella sp. 4G2]OAV43166.1 hypothetical protein A3850_001045 [Lewinella sp. 4G2]
MNRIVILLFLAFAFNISDASAQSRREKKAQAAIDELMKQPFIKAYRNNKRKVEQIAYEFKARESEFKPADVDIIRYNYRVACEEFDAVLIDIRNKMLDKRERKRLTTKEGSEEYARQVTNDLNLAMADYEQNVVQKINELTGEKAHGIGIADIKLLVDLMTDVWATIKGIDRELERMEKDYMDEKFTNVLMVTDYENLGKTTVSRSMR